MFSKVVVAGLALGICGTLATAQNGSNMTAAQIVNKNVTARGGLSAWRNVHSLTESGKMGAGGDERHPEGAQIPGVKRAGKSVAPMPSSPRLAQEAQLPFVLDLERPRKQRIELQFRGQTAIQVYDGANGWKVRPYLNRMEVENFTEDELHRSALQAELDGPLVDYASKGTKVELESTEKVEGNDTYRLKLTMKDGHSLHVWIDAKTFLEAKIEGTPRRLDGLEHPVEIYFRDWRAVDGLQVPFLLETQVLPLAQPQNSAKRAAQGPVQVEKIVIEKVQVNPKFDASLFSKPVIETASVAKPQSSVQ